MRFGALSHRMDFRRLLRIRMGCQGFRGACGILLACQTLPPCSPGSRRFHGNARAVRLGFSAFLYSTLSQMQISDEAMTAQVSYLPTFARSALSWINRRNRAVRKARPTHDRPRPRAEDLVRHAAVSDSRRHQAQGDAPRVGHGPRPNRASCRVSSEACATSVRELNSNKQPRHVRVSVRRAGPRPSRRGPRWKGVARTFGAADAQSRRKPTAPLSPPHR
jgi:hypothetical protein